MQVELETIVKTYGTKKALDIPSWVLKNGEVVGLVGSNGAGKTTFLRILLDLLRADRGKVLLNGKDIRYDSRWRARTGAFLDRSFLIEYLTIPEYLEFVGATFGFSRKQTAERLEPFTAFLPMAQLDRRRLLRDLSTGNAKKVGIVAALFAQPALVVLDEPFANLDPPSQIRLKHILADMAADPGRSMIISSHDLGHITEVCGRITLLHSGAIKQDLATSQDTLSALNAWFTNEGIASAT